MRLIRRTAEGWEALIEAPGTRAHVTWEFVHVGWRRMLEMWGPLTEVVPPRPDLPTDDRPVWAGGTWWWPRQSALSGRRGWSSGFYGGALRYDDELVELGIEVVAPDVPGHPWPTAPNQGGQR